ncbi:casein kinase II subunit alpha [Capronia epimyces CBS 606.96]|uniref:Casein kinase II subunit alpha n=1 Tax=Capronia epimyces CBS 606.96 TaxID=1182542 RepID=W9YI18_9EURO|nr:casein kinase II subunit alpha [Capronia epimyces CBS 606.96]EXJ88876.1 casein kinase II subunit alpha [Capronia epimyces CBS 606.96]
MAFSSKKRKSAAIVHDDSDVDADVSTKRGKGISGVAFQPATKPQSDSDGNIFWEISKNRRVTLSDFKGKKLVNIREYYQKDSEWLPGKKGISMSLEQYSALIDIMPQVEEVLKQQGETVPRPNYSGSAQAAEENGEEEDEEDEEKKLKKENIEATSDEEE